MQLQRISCIHYISKKPMFYAFKPRFLFEQELNIWMGLILCQRIAFYCPCEDLPKNIHILDTSQISQAAETQAESNIWTENTELAFTFTDSSPGLRITSSDFSE